VWGREGVERERERKGKKSKEKKEGKKERRKEGKKERRKEGKKEREILFPVRISSNNLIYGAILENVLFIFMKGLIDAAASFNKLL